jgi:hypothetical protein
LRFSSLRATVSQTRVHTTFGFHTKYDLKMGVAPAYRPCRQPLSSFPCGSIASIEALGLIDELISFRRFP